MFILRTHKQTALHVVITQLTSQARRDIAHAAFLHDQELPLYTCIGDIGLEEGDIIVLRATSCPPIFCDAGGLSLHVIVDIEAPLLPQLSAALPILLQDPVTILLYGKRFPGVTLCVPSVRKPRKPTKPREKQESKGNS